MLIFAYNLKAMEANIKKAIREAIKANKIPPHNFEITNGEMDLLNNIQDDLFGILNTLQLVFVPTSEETLRDYCIAYRIYPQIKPAQFLKIYSTIHKAYS